MSAAAGFARPPARSRGIALLVALILVALSTAIAAALSFDTGLGLRRAQGGLAQDQALLLAGGAEAIAAEILVDDLAGGNAPVHFAQRWHNPIGPLEPLPAVRVEAQLEDLQGRFNLNSLVDTEGRTDPVAVQVFRRLLLRLELEPEWAERMADWIDADDQALPSGAEDAAYSSAVPAPQRNTPRLRRRTARPGRRRRSSRPCARPIQAPTRDAAAVGGTPARRRGRSVLRYRRGC